MFDADGKYRRVIGSIKGGEGYFKRPTGIAIDSEAHRIYVTDTLRNQVFVLDLNDGQILQKIGKSGTGQPSRATAWWMSPFMRNGAVMR